MSLYWIACSDKCYTTLSWTYSLAWSCNSYCLLPGRWSRTHGYNHPTFTFYIQITGNIYVESLPDWLILIDVYNRESYFHFLYTNHWRNLCWNFARLTYFDWCLLWRMNQHIIQALIYWILYLMGQNLALVSVTQVQKMQINLTTCQHKPSNSPLQDWSTLTQALSCQDTNVVLI